MTLLTSVLGGVFLFLLLIALFLYYKPTAEIRRLRQLLSSKKKEKTVYSYSDFLNAYNPAYVKLGENKGVVKSFLNGELMQRFNDLYMKAQFSRPAGEELRKVLAAKAAQSADVAALLRDDRYLADLKAKTGNLPRKDMDYAFKAAEYLMDAHRSLADSMRHFAELTSTLSEDLERLEKEGNYLGSGNIKTEGLEKRLHLQTQIFESLEAAGRLSEASMEELRMMRK
jgi:hypothetical protein